ncbi:MAG: sigma-54-dependent Fis family transcriptional regulator [Bdellovibrionaceae bacterium]|nr:sigma-54-dependent Fis family transcriptional regulator [Pseudobdellovibrionaceae bacterium]
MEITEFNLLVVDDDPLIHQIFKTLVSKPWRLYNIQDYHRVPTDVIFHAAFVDMNLTADLTDPIGVNVIKTLSSRDTQTEIVAMSGHLERKTMEACLISGAQKFLAKPLSKEELQSTLEKILAHCQIRNFDFHGRGKHLTRWVGQSEASQKILKQISQMKSERRSILIEGETGSGKEVIASLLHSQESERPFVAVNSSSIPETLFESEMFGHVKGAFTGADSHKIGLTEAAHGGDLFLDEIEAMPLSFQAKLLRFLESGEIRRVGAKEPTRVHVRTIVASNRPLQEMIKKGEFREDLYYRLSSQKIVIPPLRERRDDIPALANHFLETERPYRNKSFESEAMDVLKAYGWPGNVRELKRIIEQLCLTSPLPIIRVADIANLLEIKARSGRNPPDSLTDSYNLADGLESVMRVFEKKMIETALKQFHTDIDETARFLKVSRSNLYKKIKDLKITES